VRHALTVWAPDFIGRADDDAYVRLELILADLALLRARQLNNIAYGAMEWYGVEESTGYVRAWGQNPRQAGDAWIEQQQQQQRRRARAPPLGRPFPFLKGPLAVYDAQLAGTLIRRAAKGEEVDGAVTPKPTHALGGGRVMEDVSVGVVLAHVSKQIDPHGPTPPDHLFAANRTRGVVWVDIGRALTRGGFGLKRAGGFIELRPSVNLSNAYAACFKVVHMGSRAISWRAQHADYCHGCTLQEEFSTAMLAAHAHSRAGVRPSRGPFKCEAAQPSWYNWSRGVVLSHADDTYCFFTRVAYCELGAQ